MKATIRRTVHHTLILSSSLLWVACGSSKEEPPPASTGSSLMCEKDPNRPTALFDAVKALKTASDGKKDPTSISVNLVPNHWSSFWMTPSIGLSVAKREIGCATDMSAAAVKGDPDAVHVAYARLQEQGDAAGRASTLEEDNERFKRERGEIGRASCRERV